MISFDTMILARAANHAPTAPSATGPCQQVLEFPITITSQDLHLPAQMTNGKKADIREVKQLVEREGTPGTCAIKMERCYATGTSDIEKYLHKYA